MNRAIFILILVCLVWGAYLLFYSDRHRQELQEVTANNGKLGWRHFEPNSGKFSVDLPVMPHQASETINDATTQQLRRYEMYVSEGQNETVYLINLITYPNEEDLDNHPKLFQSFIDDMLKANSNNELISSSPTQHQGLDGMDFKIKTQNATMNSKMFIEGRTLYVLSKVSKTETDDGDFEKFVSSFKISNKSEDLKRNK